MRPRTILTAGSLVFALATPFGVRAESAVLPPAVLISDLQVTEGDSGLTPFTVSVSLGYYYNGPLPLTVKVTATPATASDKDFTFTTTEVSLSAGDAGVQTVSGYIVGDIEPEGDETIFLTATPVANDAGYSSFIYSSGGRITIKDDDQARASRLHVEGATVLEGDQGTTKAEVRVVLEPASTSTVTVAYQSQDGTAVAKSDYLPVSGTLSFAPGEVLKTVSIDVLGDTTVEPDETFSVVLLNPTMALLGTARADVVIVNDDVAPSPPDPPTGRPESDSDAGIVDSKKDASGPTTTIDSSSASSTDVRSVFADGSPGSLTGDSGSLSANDSGGGGARASFNSGCSCSMDGSSRPTGMLLIVGAALAGWLSRRRRTAIVREARVPFEVARRCR